MNWYYIIEAGLIHLVLYLGYHLFLRKQNDYRYMRRYLLGAMIVALVTPFLQLPILPNSLQIPQAQEILLSPVTITGVGEGSEGAVASSAGFFDWGWIPIAISTGIAISMIYAFLFILTAFHRSRSSVAFGVPVRLLPQQHKSFTFLKYIFTPEQPEESVIHHEKAHADLLHSVDVLLSHTFRIFFWWTPSCWWTIRELRLIHEYQADEKALASTSPEEYKKVLISRTLSSMNLSLASSFHHGALLKRLNAMQAKRESINKWRTEVLGILVAATIIVFSCTDSEIQEIAQGANMSVSYPESVQEMLDDIKAQYPDKEFSVLEVLHDSDIRASLGSGDEVKWNFTPEIKEKLHEIGEEKLVRYAENSTNGDLMYVIVENSAELKRVSEVMKSDEGIYTIVEDKPTFEGGTGEFYKYVGSNMQYPTEARKMGIQGKVYVQMIINEDGSVSDVQAVRGIGAGCDAEALRVIKNSPKWNPGKVDGKPVKVKMMIPILFQLNDSEADPETLLPPPLHEN